MADGVFWVSTPLPFAGLRQVNLWLLKDGDGWTMVDCGFGYEAARAVIAAAWRETLGEAGITRLVVTHYHPDHIGNSAWISERWGVRPFMTEGEWSAATVAIRDKRDDAVARRVGFYRAHGLDEGRLAVLKNGATFYSTGVRLPPSFQRLSDGDGLTIGADRWTIVVGEGHSPEHAALYCADRRLLISGDQILPTITTNISVWPTEPDSDPLNLFLRSCRRFAELLHPDTLVLPSHRLPFRNVHRRLEALARHHEERLDLILRSTDREIAAADLIDVLFPRKLDGHQMGFAMGEAIAHLNHLVTRGRMERVTDGSGATRYRKLG